MQDSILIIDCKDVHHVVKIDNVLDFSTYQTIKNPPITTVKLKETLENGVHKDFKTYELEDDIRLRFSKIYDSLHGI